MKKFTLTTTSLIVLAILFVALIVLSNNLLRGVRLDLTENKLYTLSDGTERILAGITEPINLYFFYSDQASRDIPVLRTYATRVRELLEEFELKSNAKIDLHIIDPQPFSEDEDRAAQFGLQAVPIGASGESVYLGLAGTNSVDGVEVIRFFQPDKEQFLEYDLSKLIYSLANPKKPVVGLISTLPISGGFDPATRQPRQPWVAYDQITQLFEVRDLGANPSEIADDIDVLILVHPRELEDNTLYAIDQFVLAGGRALIFLDPHAEIDQPAPNPQNPASMFAERSSDLKTLLDPWGVAVSKDQILRDARYALPINANPQQPPVRHFGILRIDQSGLAADDVITEALSTVTMAMAGFISLADDAKVTLTPLLRSSSLAQPIATENVRFVPDPKALQENFEPTGEEYILAARVSGAVPSAFPDGAPKADTGEGSSEQPAEQPAKPHLAQGEINVILVADVDFLSDRLWIQFRNFLGQRLPQAWANNGDMFVNAVDNLLGNSDLLSMRGRATSLRPFTTVQELERQADAEFRVKEQELSRELEETERNLSELQNARTDQSGNSGVLILSPEQQAELERFQARKLQIRKELRQVRRDLDKNIESLGNWMKFINIGLIPIILTTFGLLMLIGVRSWRYRTR